MIFIAPTQPIKTLRGAINNRIENNEHFVIMLSTGNRK
tara:strand:+ start:236 stop:349 length:114 start_codon:yes stop_codon:yes gene_type:complete